MAWFRTRQDAYTEHLLEEIGWLRLQLVHERARAERAVDTLLSFKAGVPPVTVATPAERAEEASFMQRLLSQDPEFAAAGGDLG